MKSNNCSTSACRYCRFYNPEGRRGGHCSKLNVLVKAHWKSCQFACPAFEDNWQTLPEIVMLEKTFTLGCASPSSELKSINKISSQSDLDSEGCLSSDS